MTAPGRFITLEGGEGSGKSTLVAALSEALAAKGFDLLTTREPGGTRLAETVRDLVLLPPGEDTWSPLAEALLMNAARSDHVDRKIRPALDSGQWVLCDRYADSTLVYQGIGGVREDVLLTIQAEVTKVARPDLTLILDGPVDKLLPRRKQRGTSDTFESRPQAFHEAVRDGFLKIASQAPDRCVVLDATQPPDNVLDQAMRAITSRLGLPA